MGHSQRNKDLRSGVIDAIMSAIRELCEHETLQYTWMRYLPLEGTHHWDTFWKVLVDGIKMRLQEEEVIRTRGKGVLRCIEHMERLPQSSYDRHGNPLFPDLDPEIYLSEGYEGQDLDILESFGLEWIVMMTTIKTVWRDLLRSPSKLRSQSTDDDWHTRAAIVLRKPWTRDGWETSKAKIRRLPIIPLEDGSWATAADGDVFYANIGNISIPKDLMLRTVAPGATKNAKRRALFDSMGVRSASTSMIRSRILSLYAQAEMGDISFENSMEHLKFLYLTNQSRSEEEMGSELCVYDHLGRLRKLSDHDLYIQNDHPYGAERLMATGVMASFNAFFVSPKYFEEAPTAPSGACLSWVEWMHDYLGVMRDIRLLNVDKDSLSEECKHIAEHRNVNFLGFLKHVWPEQGGGVINNENILAELRSTNIMCKGEFEERLSSCYLPLRELQNAQARFDDYDIFPFLDIEDSNESNLLLEWSFLTKVIGVRWKNDLDFRLDLLERCAQYHGKSTKLSVKLNLFDIYMYIEAFCMESVDTSSMRDRV